MGFLLSSFPRQTGSPEATEMMLQAYAMAIEDAPTWAIEEAARRWISGKCGSKRFAPSPPELRCAADEVVVITRGKIASLRKLAAAETVIEPNPERFAQLEAALKGAIDHANVGDRKPLHTTKAEAA